MLSSFKCQVSQKSPNLTMFKGYIMKLRLNCTKRPMLSSSNKKRTEDSCLLFKVKGEVQCKYCKKKLSILDTINKNALNHQMSYITRTMIFG